MTLKDVKAAVDREGNYRYHFKALDPEFGTVKEEVRERIPPPPPCCFIAEQSQLPFVNVCLQVFLDGAIIPGWEGKIVAWLEEDRGEER